MASNDTPPLSWVTPHTASNDTPPLSCVTGVGVSWVTGVGVSWVTGGGVSWVTGVRMILYTEFCPGIISLEIYPLLTKDPNILWVCLSSNIM
jgi:hypothetical protein